MKKISLVVLSAIILGLFTPLVQAEDITSITQEAGYQVTPELAPKASIVVDAESGRILWADHIDMERDPASTTKTMVVYLTMKAIKEGKIRMDTEVVATANDQAIADIYALSNNKIKEGVTYTVSELLTMTLVPSSNVTTLMLAHLIHDGDDASFIALMNQTAKDLGMANTVFHNGTGAIVSAFEGYYAPEGYDHHLPNVTTAKDLATLAYHLINEHPEILQFTDDVQTTVKQGTPYEETFDSYNHSLPNDPMGIEGVDGLKTGSSPSAGYNSIVTAKRGDTRLITVVLGASQWGDPQGEFVRHYYVNALLEKTFKEYTRERLLEKGRQDINGKTYEVQEDLYGLVKTGEEKPELVVEGDKVMLSEPNGYLAVPSGSPVVESKGFLDFGSSRNNGQKDDTSKSNGFFSKIPQLVAGIALLIFGLCGVLFVLHELKQRRDK